MSASRAYRALLLSAGGVLAGLGAAWWLPINESGHAGAVHYAVTWCGQALSVIHGAGHPAGRRELLLLTLLASMGLAGLIAAVRTWNATRTIVLRLTKRTMPPPVGLATAAAAAGLSDRVVVSDSQDVFCFCFGLLRPRVCISVGLLEILDPNELAAVLAHEHHHVHERDPLKLAIANVLAALAYPLPLVAALRGAYLVGRELDADRAAILAVGRSPLASTLCKILSHPRAHDLRAAAAAGAADGSRARITQIISPGAPLPRLGRGSVLASLASVAVFAALLFPSANQLGDGALAHASTAAPVTIVADMCDPTNGNVRPGPVRLARHAGVG